ncbi:methyltransferase [Leptospira perolatii]|uniref:Methyltransferase n=1 Tax=Leptospira perolatii TaxID=2023191 RepID=A0A2M9ZKR7_9LEPT|nr:methyltransferase [Leptospira perolatii]PJZ69398.1 methyltransferase [Leptospira perolatii]PJZ72533.1 methyltransferase [Leptospira perolatii]
MADSKSSKHSKRGTSIYKEGIEAWIDSDLVKRPFSWLYELEAKAKMDEIPVLGPASGAVLAFLASSWIPDRILELGTGYGVSLIWVLSGLSNSPESIQSVDREIQFIEVAQSYLDRIQNYSNQILFKEGECLESLRIFLNRDIENKKEFLFVDCDKIRYPEILRMLLQFGKGRRLRVVFDNVLWHGRPMDPEWKAPSDLAIREFWTELRKTDLNYTLFPVGDGLLSLDFSK